MRKRPVWPYATIPTSLREITMRLLITGVKSGLGCYLHRDLGGFGLARDNASDMMASLSQQGVDIIIHCAFAMRQTVGFDQVEPYFRDNVQLTERLLAIPHRKFIYLSSVHVYPQNGQQHREDDPIRLCSKPDCYSTFKLLNEALVTSAGRNPLILRPSSFLGVAARSNTITRIIFDPYPSVTVASDSQYNFVLYGDVRRFIARCIREDIGGTFNVASTGNMPLHELAAAVRKKPVYGAFRYEVGNISTEKICSVDGGFSKSSRETMLEFLEVLRRHNQPVS